jgi:hypothetical protein
VSGRVLFDEMLSLSLRVCNKEEEEKGERGTLRSGFREEKQTKRKEKKSVAMW